MVFSISEMKFFVSKNIELHNTKYFSEISMLGNCMVNKEHIHCINEHTFARPEKYFAYSNAVMKKMGS